MTAESLLIFYNKSQLFEILILRLRSLNKRINNKNEETENFMNYGSYKNKHLGKMKIKKIDRKDKKYM